MLKTHSFLLPMLASLVLFAGSARAEEDRVFVNEGEDIILRDAVGNPCPVRFEKVGPREVKRGKDVTYYIKIKNLSQCIFTKLELVDILDRDLKFEFADPRPDKVDKDMRNDETKLFWFRERLRVGQSKLYQIEAEVKYNARGEVTNTACIRNQHLGPRWFCKKVESRVEHHNGGGNGGPGLE